jgi:GxxExxY protein
MSIDQNTLKQAVYPIVGACHEVHKHLGAFLNEYMYQDALAIELSCRNIPYEKEFAFSADYKGQRIEHQHKADFCVHGADTDILIECKAADKLIDTHRQQLWNYMRLSGIHVGVLYNFAPMYAQCEKYYYDPVTVRMIAF